MAKRDPAAEVYKAVERAIQYRMDSIVVDVIDDVDRHAESPIELVMGRALVAAAVPNCATFTAIVSSSKVDISEITTPEDILEVDSRLHSVLEDCLSSRYEIWPQVTIEKYRVDFLVRFLRYSWKEHRFDVEQAVVECDGHDYHEKTKEQARRDKRRDRRMTAQGLKVYRFTGSEIWKDPMGCAHQVFELINKYHHMEVE